MTLPDISITVIRLDWKLNLLKFWVLGTRFCYMHETLQDSLIKICQKIKLGRFNIWAASWQNRPVWSESSLSAWRTLGSFMRTAKTLIRLGGCPGWSESSLGAQPHCWFCHVVANLLSMVGWQEKLLPDTAVLNRIRMQNAILFWSRHSWWCKAVEKAMIINRCSRIPHPSQANKRRKETRTPKTASSIT